MPRSSFAMYSPLIISVGRWGIVLRIYMLISGDASFLMAVEGKSFLPHANRYGF